MKFLGKGTMEKISKAEPQRELKKAKDFNFIVMLDMLYVIHLQLLKNCYLAVISEIVLKNIVRV